MPHTSPTPLLEETRSISPEISTEKSDTYGLGYSLQQIDGAIEETKNHLHELLLLQQHLQRYTGKESRFKSNFELRVLVERIERTKELVCDATREVLEYKAIRRLHKQNHTLVEAKPSDGKKEELEEANFKEMVNKIYTSTLKVVDELHELTAMTQLISHDVKGVKGFSATNQNLYQVLKFLNAESRKYVPITKDILAHTFEDALSPEAPENDLKVYDHTRSDDFEYGAEIIELMMKNAVSMRYNLWVVDQGMRSNTLSQDNMFQILVLTGSVNSVLESIFLSMKNFKADLEAKGYKVPAKVLRRLKEEHTKK